MLLVLTRQLWNVKASLLLLQANASCLSPVSICMQLSLIKVVGDSQVFRLKESANPSAYLPIPQFTKGKK